MVYRDRDVRVFYPAHNVSGGGLRVSHDASGHILLHGVLLCGQPIAEVIKKAMADKGTVRSGVIPGNPMCRKCELLWKENTASGWKKWIGK
jgi:hypothetical protein